MTISDKAVATAVKRTPFYFGEGDDALIAWLHTPTNSPVSDTCVVVCPPLAVEYMSTYRPLRYVADYFAEAGIPALRFDYHGTGDASGYIEDENRINTWVSNIEQACDHLKQLTGCTKVGLLGFRMGANLAALAAEKLQLEFLVLWAAFPRGRNFVREVKTLQMTAKVKDSEDTQYLEAGGTAYWQQTVEDISAINLAKLKPNIARSLIIPRDDFTADTKLNDAWQEQGLNVEQRELPGSADMILNAYYAIVPHETIKETVAWVKSGITTQATTTPETPVHGALTTSVELQHYNGCQQSSAQAVSVRETIYWYGPDKSRFAILVEPSANINPDLPTLVISNSGSTHRVGPSRLYVLLARECARMGMRTLRLDMPGLGDSYVTNMEEENITYINESSKEIKFALQALRESHQCEKFILTGLCSGAFFSFVAAYELKEVDIVECMLINPLTFYWQDGMTVEDSPLTTYSNWNWYKQALRNSESWKKLFSGKIDFKLLLGTVTERIRLIVSSKLAAWKNESGKDKQDENDKGPDDASDSKLIYKNLHKNLKSIAELDRHLSFILAKKDPGYDIMKLGAGKLVKKLRRKKKISLHFIENADHTFSKYKPRCAALTEMVEHIHKRYINKQ